MKKFQNPHNLYLSKFNKKNITNTRIRQEIVKSQQESHKDYQNLVLLLLTLFQGAQDYGIPEIPGTVMGFFASKGIPEKPGIIMQFLSVR